MPGSPPDQSAARVFLLRHGQSVANVQRLIASSPAVALAAYGLTETGREQVQRSVAAARAAELLPAECRIVSSPLLRARESAEVAAGVLGTTIRIDARLSERAFGELELSSDEHYEQVWAADRTDPTHERWGVESVAALLGRASALVQELRANGGGTYVLCTHGDVASVLLCAAGGLALEEHRSVGALDNGELRILGVTESARSIPTRTPPVR